MSAGNLWNLAGKFVNVCIKKASINSIDFLVPDSFDKYILSYKINFCN